MILEGIGIILTLAGLYKIYETNNYEEIKLIEKFQNTIEIIEEKSYLNEKNKMFRFVKSIKKHYGYDFVISIPIGHSYKKLEDMIPTLETAMGCDIKLNWVKDENCAYMRLYKRNAEGTELVRYKWNKIMRSKKLFNASGETFELNNLVSEENYGYSCNIVIPEGLSQENIRDIQDILNSAYGYVYVDFKEFTNKIPAKIVTKPLPDNYKFNPVETKPYQLYIGTTHYYKDMIVDMSTDPHILLSGSPNSGKSVLLNMAIANQIYFHTEKEVEFYFIETAEKTNDFDDFLKCKQVRAFAYTFEYAYKLLNHICEQIKERSKLFSKARVKNIYQYNDEENEKLPIIYVITEEIPSLMPDTEKSDPNYAIKSKCTKLIDTIAAQGRFAGIYLIGTVQRSDKESIRPIIKSNLNTRIALKQNNEASSLVVIDSPDAIKLPRREAIVLTSGEYTRIKTPYIDKMVIYNTIKKSIDKNYKLMTFNQPKNIILPQVAVTSEQKPSNNIINLPNKSKGDVKINVAKSKR